MDLIPTGMHGGTGNEQWSCLHYAGGNRCLEKCEHPVQGSDRSTCRPVTISIEKSAAVLKGEPVSALWGLSLQDSSCGAASGERVSWVPCQFFDLNIWKLQGPTMYLSGNILMSSEPYYPGTQSSGDCSLDCQALPTSCTLSSPWLCPPKRSYKNTHLSGILACRPSLNQTRLRSDWENSLWVTEISVTTIHCSYHVCGTWFTLSFKSCDYFLCFPEHKLLEALVIKDHGVPDRDSDMLIGICSVFSHSSDKLCFCSLNYWLA